MNSVYICKNLNINRVFNTGIYINLIMKEKMRMLLMLFLVISIGSYAQDNVVKNKIISIIYIRTQVPIPPNFS